MWTYREVRAIGEQDPRFLGLLREKCESSFLDFCVIIFPMVYGFQFRVNRHHKIICKVLEAVYRLEILRLIINIPPGYTKTELVIKLFSAWCFAKDPRARFMHTSYSEELAIDNSSKVKDIVESDIFSLLWPMKIRGDKKGNKWWAIEGHGGYFIAAPILGQITGRRAGVLGAKGFMGALEIDDPMKVEDANSVAIRTKINRTFKSTVRNRVATERVPIILIMQRLHKTDLTGFLLQGGTGEKWHHLIMEADIPSDGLHPVKYKREWTHGIPVKFRYSKGPLWEYKHNAEDLNKIKSSDSYIWGAQYQQNPVSEGMSIIHEGWWRYYRKYLPEEGTLLMQDGHKEHLAYKSIFADTAMKAEEKHDYSVFQCWGRFVQFKAIALLDQERGKWEAPDLQDEFKAFILRHSYEPGVVALGLRTVAVEDKASGIGLIQSLNRDPEMPIQIEGIPRNKDKVSRGKSGAPSIKRGEVYLPEDAHFLGEYLVEMTEFNEYMTHDNDDQFDPTMDAIDQMLINEVAGYENFV